MHDTSRPTTDHIPTLVRDTFHAQALEAPGHVVVEFMSYGCGHCRAIEPIVQDVAAQRAGKETFFRVNIAAEQELANEYDIQVTPTFVMFAKGREVARVEGPEPKVSSLLSAVTEPFDA